MNLYYVYVLLDTRKKGHYQYGSYIFDYEPFYIGKGKGNRVKDHFKSYDLNKKSNPFKSAIINCIINEDLPFETVKIHDNLSNNEALEREIELISLIGRRNIHKGPLTNLTDGGEGTENRICSQETKNKMSNQRKGKKQTPAQYAANCNRKQTHFQKEMTSKLFKGKKQSQELIESRRIANTGLKRSQETKNKMSNQRKGKKQTSAQYAANCNRIKNFISYDEFKEWLKFNNIKSSTQLKIFYITNLIGKNVPKNPYSVYKKRNQWISWRDLFDKI